MVKLKLNRVNLAHVHTFASISNSYSSPSFVFRQKINYPLILSICNNQVATMPEFPLYCRYLSVEELEDTIKSSR